MKRIVILWMALIAISLQTFADEKVSFTTSAPEAVAVGDQFRLSYTVTTQKVRDFRAPSIKGFDVLMGPSRSTQVTQVNNDVSASITFTYILMAKEEGEFTIPGAVIVADGNEMISNSVKVKVLPADQQQANQGSSNGQRANGSIANNDLFITATANKVNVYEQEALLLTYKIYTAVNLRGFDNVKLPDFKGFHSQEVELPNDRRWGLEHYKGRNYQTTVYRQFVLFPQQSGNLTIEQARFDASIAVEKQVSDPFEAFFNGGGMIEVKKTLMTPKLTIKVSELPAGKPENFSGGVGEFTISSSINTTELKANEAVTIKLVVSGIGNLKLVSAPEVKFPEDFEIYDPKVENNFRLTTAGQSGNQVIEYLAIPRNAGTYKIPAVTFSYFDIKSQSYKTLTTEEYTLNVSKGTGSSSQTVSNYTNKEELKVLNQDIRFIKQNAVSLKPHGEFFFGTTAYWLYYLIPMLLFVVVFVIYRKQISENSNIAKVRTKKANKIAVKRMKEAGNLLKANKKDAFYDEVLKALWGYVSDKLNIPVSQLSKDNVEEALIAKNVDNELIKTFIKALNDCEFARFAPGDPAQAMDNLYQDAINVISKMENSIKK
ncbi:MAG: protein BatD [Mediterranea massiliensis]|nr:protein BatD [Mediterranea massiliensis]